MAVSNKQRKSDRDNHGGKRGEGSAHSQRTKPWTDLPPSSGIANLATPWTSGLQERIFKETVVGGEAKMCENTRALYPECSLIILTINSKEINAWIKK